MTSLHLRSPLRRVLAGLMLATSHAACRDVLPNPDDYVDPGALGTQSSDPTVTDDPNDDSTPSSDGILPDGTTIMEGTSEGVATTQDFASGTTIVADETTSASVPCGGSMDGSECIASGSFLGGDVTQTVAAFFMDRTEVTVAQYRACVMAEVCFLPPEPFVYFEPGSPYNYGGPDRDEHPMNGIDWFDAQTYCAWTGGRLPTEWEWEWAARGRDAGQTYPWGNTPEPNCDLVIMPEAEIPGCGLNTTSPVASRSPGGDTVDRLHDTIGNVWEWTDSALDEGTAMLRIIRGGAWNETDADSFRVNNRTYSPPDNRNERFGVRCARDVP